MRQIFLAVIVVISVCSAHSSAQHQLLPVSTLKGAPALELALRKLDTVGSFMMTTAHPDDENNAMLAYFSHGKGFRTTLVTATHGEGGQNEIGPELFEALAVLRTEELAAAHKFDGAEQFFTRAIDFGFSFSVEETLEKWGHQEILGDYVRMIRTIRPDVIVGFVFDGDGGGQHHQTSTILTLEAFRAAASRVPGADQRGCGLAGGSSYTAANFGPPGRRRPRSAASLVRGPAVRRSRAARCSILCLAAPTGSREKRAACTSARACRSCCRCRRQPGAVDRWDRWAPAASARIGSATRCSTAAWRGPTARSSTA